MEKQNIETEQELELIEAVEKGNCTSLAKPEFDELKASLQDAAKNTYKKLSKRKAVSIRLLEDDIEKLKAISLNEGIPYQTYLTHIIHKIATGRVAV